MWKYLIFRQIYFLNNYSLFVDFYTSFIFVFKQNSALFEEERKSVTRFVLNISFCRHFLFASLEEVNKFITWIHL